MFKLPITFMLLKNRTALYVAFCTSIFKGGSIREIIYSFSRATHMGYVEILSTGNAISYRRLPETFHPSYAFKMLTDNGKESPDCSCASGPHAPAGSHVFDQVYPERAI